MTVRLDLIGHIYHNKTFACVIVYNSNHNTATVISKCKDGVINEFSDIDDEKLILKTKPRTFKERDNTIEPMIRYAFDKYNCNHFDCWGGLNQ